MHSLLLKVIEKNECSVTTSMHIRVEEREDLPFLLASKSLSTSVCAMGVACDMALRG